MFNRLDLLIGKEKRIELSKKVIMIIGIGGVGGYIIESLARSGIENFILIDYDKVDITNINRQIIALKTNIGEKKVDVLEERMKNINPNINIIKLDMFLEPSNINIINNYKIDYLIDACDYIPTKKELINKCTKDNIPFISCMGTGKRLDASKLEITLLDKTNYDPIARILRKYVKDNKINKKIKVLASKEVPQKIESKEIASCCFVPAVAGILVGNYVFNELLKK